MNKISFKVVLPILFLIMGCSSLQNFPSRKVRISIPEKETVKYAELGDTVVRKGSMFTQSKAILRNSTSTVFGTIQPGEYIAQQQDSDFIYYFRLDNPASGAIGISKSKPLDVRVCHFSAAVTYKLKGNPPPLVEFQEDHVFMGDSFQQELIYNGRAGDILKFLYREISSDTLRFPFNQDVQYDLRESRIVGFKGARLEVIEATNTELKYRLLRNFPDER